MSEIEQFYLGYTLGGESARGDRCLSAIIGLVRQQVPESDGALYGRRAVTHGTLEGIGPVIVKVYARGGVLGALLGTGHFRFGPVRSQCEYQMLQRVRALGINAPEPIAWVHDGGRWCRTWLVMREIAGARTLAEYAQRDDPRVSDWTRTALRNVKTLIANGILHTDLHPGNVLISGAGEVYLIDFDKTIECKASELRLRQKYLSRWRRAVIKHQLPESLAELASLELRQRVHGEA